MINRTPMGEQKRALRGIIIRATKHACVSEIGPLFATGDSQVFAVSAVGRKVGTQVPWISSRDRIVLGGFPGCDRSHSVQKPLASRSRLPTAARRLPSLLTLRCLTVPGTGQGFRALRSQVPTFQSRISDIPLVGSATVNRLNSRGREQKAASVTRRSWSNRTNSVAPTWRTMRLPPVKPPVQTAT